MIYELGKWLQDLDFAGARLLHYVSFRAICAFVLALLISTWIGGYIIKALRQKEIGETIRDLGLEGQQSKRNTPTMGGIIIIIALLVPTVLFARMDNVYIIVMLITIFFMGIIGFVDDYIKVFRKNKSGLSPKYKLIGQITTGLAVGLILYLAPSVTIRENSEFYNQDIKRIERVEFSRDETKSTKTTIPFVKNNNFDYVDLIPEGVPHRTMWGWILYIVIIILIVTFISNCVNLTDGLDGLASGTSAPVGVVLLVLAYVSSHISLASYLNIMFIPGTEELVIFGASFVGATLGFLWFNGYPAQVFMGDTGSLVLGGIIATFAIIIRKELLLPIMAGIFIIEGLSSLLQQGFYKLSRKLTGTPRRIFKMAPLHHHLQKVGDPSIEALIKVPRQTIPESKVTIRFILIAIILAALSIGTLKMR